MVQVDREEKGGQWTRYVFNQVCRNAVLHRQSSFSPSRGSLQSVSNIARELQAALLLQLCILQDALLDEEGATPADGFSGDANAVSLRQPQAKAESKQRMQTAEEAHEVSAGPPCCVIRDCSSACTCLPITLHARFPCSCLYQAGHGVQHRTAVHSGKK